MNSPLRLLSVGSAFALLASCGTMNALKQATAAGVSKVSTFSVTDLMPSRVKVVEAREKDLRELPLGKERALAYEAKKESLASRSGRGFWFFKGPVDFKEPSLPGDSGPMDGSLLPPRAN